MGADLTYFIFEGVLAGTVGPKMFQMEALSGGGGGNTLGKTSAAVNNPFDEGLKTAGKSSAKGHVHGGPIPPGKYTIKTPAHHSHLGLSAQLVHPHWKPFGRDGFYIHGRGPHGSDGCIVPLDKIRFQELMTALKASNGGTLFVQEAMDDIRFA